MIVSSLSDTELQNTTVVKQRTPSNAIHPQKPYWYVSLRLSALSCADGLFLAVVDRGSWHP